MIKVLDQGYVQPVEHWGSDERIVEAARMSTDKGFLGWGPVTKHMRQCSHCMIIEDEPGGKGDCPLFNGPHSWFTEAGSGVDRQVAGDEKLLKYLYDHKHMTPFEMAGMTIEVQAPIFVFREWHRHRTQSYNELSSRYTPLPDMFYIPSVERLMMAKQAATNKQGSEMGITAAYAEDIRLALAASYGNARMLYTSLLGSGVAREVARLCIPVAQYSRMRASANLRNWLQFLTLRMDPAAQWEIRQYAEAVGSLVAERFPRTWQLFTGAA